MGARSSSLTLPSSIDDCQLRFSLSSLNAWRETDIDFNYRDFYQAIVDYFEVTPGPVAQRNISDLLQWWNK